MNSNGAVEVDPHEHKYSHPKCAKQLEDHRKYGVPTIYDVIQQSSEKFAKRALFSYRATSKDQFQSLTYSEVQKLIHEIGSGFIHVGLEKSNQTCVGLYASANLHYALCMYACWPFSLVPVGLYDSLGLDAVRFIIRHANLKLVVADNLKRVQMLIDNQDQTSPLEIVVSIPEPSAELQNAAKNKSIRLISYSELVDLGKKNLTNPKPPKPTDLSLIMYTSGSTGDPKGCMITQDGLICSMIGTCSSLGLFELAQQQIPRVLNFLPLAHMFGCASILILTHLGGEVGFWQGEVEKLMDDFRDFRPNVLTMVPRLLNKLHDKVMTTTQERGFFATCLMNMGIRSKIAQIDQGDFSQNTIWDRLIFNRIRAMFGGQVQNVISSSAPLSPEVAKLSRAIFSCYFIEGYGQTECVTGSWQIMNDIRLGEVGVPTPVNYIKMIDVPEKQYFAKDRCGEICIKGPAVFKGYLKDEEKTRETIDEDGWLHTGDIGMWTPHNTLKIIDRKKNIYKLSNGEYVAPEKIEGIYGMSRYVSQVFVYGESLQHVLVGLVVLDDEFLKTWKASHPDNGNPNASPAKDTKLRQTVLEDLTRLGRSSGLMSYEQVKIIAIITEPFTIENGLLTPTFKARRYAIEKQYRELFQELYRSLPQ